ncbi:MAG: hypothetical protein ACK5LF_02720 [Bacteroides xylanisolvens]
MKQKKGIKSKKGIGALLFLGIMLCFNLSVYAAGNRAFTYDFKHQLALKGSYTATKSDATFQFYTDYNGSDGYLQVRQYYAWNGGLDEYVRTRYVYATQGARRDLSVPSEIGTAFTYEFWKDEDGAYIRGNGDLQY